MNSQLIPKSIMTKLKNNYKNNKESIAILKLFTPDANCTWLITMIEPDEDTMWGLCDLGFGCVEYGAVSLKEIMSVKGKMGLPVERDRFFKPLSINDLQDKISLVGC